MNNMNSSNNYINDNIKNYNIGDYNKTIFDYSPKF